MMRSPTGSGLLPGPPRLSARGVRVATGLGVLMGVIGIFVLALTLGVFFTQNSQIRVTARVLSRYNCHDQVDFATHQGQFLCDATVVFTTANGQTIRTVITGLLPSEFHGTGQAQTTDLRYDPGDPTQPFKQSNYMSVSNFAVGLAVGVICLLAAGWIVRRARRLGPGRAAG